MSTVNQVVAGLSIIAKYSGDSNDIDAQHDMISAGAEAAEKMTDEEKLNMKAVGWSWDEHNKCFYIWV
jgi:hypothetical protein